jgi:hypothetical protein
MNVDTVIAMSERVLRLRKELAEAEAVLEGFIRGRPVASAPTTGIGVRRTGPPATGNSSPSTRITRSSTPSRGATPVSQRVAKLLVMRGPTDFSTIFAAVQPAERGAVKSALNKGRERGEYTLRDGKYEITPKTKKARPVVRPSPDTNEARAT